MSGGDPLISVIVPVHNGEGYLPACLDSILAQTYPCLEVIAVDDGSTDGSGSICDAFSQKDHRLQAVHLPFNRGPSAARNAGIRRARGTYLTFVDADDYIEPDMLERLSGDLRRNRADISICGNYGPGPQGGSPRVLSREEAVFCLSRRVPFDHGPWGKLYLTALAKRSLFDERISFCEDFLFVYRALKGARRVSYFPDKLYHYVCREGSLVNSGVTEKKYRSMALVHRLICEDAAANFPALLPGFRSWAICCNRWLAVLAVRDGVEGGAVFRYLRRFQGNIRRYLSREALALCPKRRIPQILLLSLSATAFWGIGAAYDRTRRLWKKGRKWIKANR